jgi:hypothetical protein
MKGSVCVFRRSNGDGRRLKMALLTVVFGLGCSTPTVGDPLATLPIVVNVTPPLGQAVNGAVLTARLREHPGWFARDSLTEGVAGPTSTTLVLSNFAAGTVVGTLEVIGTPAPWWSVTPDTVLVANAAASIGRSDTVRVAVMWP